MYDAFFEERGLIPPGQYHEVRFEELEADPIGQMQRVYEALDLPAFSQARPALERYVDGVRGYRKNEFPELPVALRRRIADAWRPCFEEWGYRSEPEAGISETPSPAKTDAPVPLPRTADPHQTSARPGPTRTSCRSQPPPGACGVSSRVIA